jgi:hypothetical protein
MIKNGTRIASSPGQAHKAYWDAPKQRNVYLVRFSAPGQTGASTETLSSMSFAAKMIEGTAPVQQETVGLYRFQARTGADAVIRLG